MAIINTGTIRRFTSQLAPGEPEWTLFRQHFSADARYIVSSASVPSTSNYVILHDTWTGQKELISVTYDGSPPEGSATASVNPSVSDDGRFVVFWSFATNLVPGDTNGERDVFLRDRLLGTTTLMSASADGTPGNDESWFTEISPDGRYVTFSSRASNIVAGDTNHQLDLFMRDLSTGVTTILSRSAAGAQGNGYSQGGAFSANSRYVLIESAASNLVAGDTNSTVDVFLRDLTTGALSLVSLSDNDTQGNNASLGLSVSNDGRYVLFNSYASNLVANDTNGKIDLFLRDIVAGTTIRISEGITGAQSNRDTTEADMSADGRFIVFANEASLTPGDTNAVSDIFLRDMVEGTLTRLSVGPGGIQANGDSWFPQITPDGRYVSFNSTATNLSSGDVNSVGDVFLISLFATGDADNLIGSDANNTIDALGGDDTVRSGLGNDVINGGAGNDMMYGGAGNDTYYVDSSKDIVDESVAGSGGSDTVRSGNISINLAYSTTYRGTIESAVLEGSLNLDLTGTAGANYLQGNRGNNRIDGGLGPDRMVGLAGNDTYYVDSVGDVVDESVNGSGGSDMVRSSTISINLGNTNTMKGNIESAVLEGNANLIVTGNTLANYLQGNAGNNFFNGGGGSDTLVGLGGSDTFFFSNSLGPANIDTIKDYNVAQDLIELDNAQFTALLATGVLSAAAFVANTTGLATTTSQHIIYETDTGKLFYDSNGSAAGGTYLQFAQLSAGLAMTAGEFFVT